MALLTQFLTLLLLAVGASHGQCPPPEDILPCSCTVADFTNMFDIKVFCWKVDDVDVVRWALQSVKGIQRVAVEFDNSPLGWVPSDLFKGLHVTHLYFINCVLKRIGDKGRSALEGLEDIAEKLIVVESFHFDNSLNFLNVSRLRSLELLLFTGNNVNEVDNARFADGPANLNQLFLTSNGIWKLGDSAFAQLTNCRELFLDHNRIYLLNRSMFPSPAVNLEKISLSDNKISSLPVDLFSNMPKLKTVMLQRNSIQRIPEATWTSVWSRLEILNLNDNPLNCDADIEWVIKERRPKYLLGKCVSPAYRKGVNLEKIIDDKQKNK